MAEVKGIPTIGAGAAENIALAFEREVAPEPKMTSICPHVPAAAHAPRAPGCEECLATGGRWVHLRLCLTCGHVGCCDSSPGKHATKHFQTARHPVVQSLEPGETWGWCYVDSAMLGPFPALR